MCLLEGGRNLVSLISAVFVGYITSDPGYSRDLDADGDGRACEVKPNY